MANKRLLRQWAGDLTEREKSWEEKVRSSLVMLALSLMVPFLMQVSQLEELKAESTKRAKVWSCDSELTSCDYACLW